MRGNQQVQALALFQRICDGLDVPDSARTILGLAPRATSRPPLSARAIPPRDTRPALAPSPASALLNLDSGDRQEDPVRRRTFVGLTGATIVSAMLDAVPSPGERVDAEPLAPVLAGHPDGTASLETAPDIATLTAAATNARRQYQACRYSGLIKHLPGLLSRLPITGRPRPAPRVRALSRRAPRGGRAAAQAR
jgi:hypothetical protein